MNRIGQLASLGSLVVLACACAPREPFTVDTALRDNELERTPKQAPAYCEVAEPAVLQRAAIPDTPRWFFKPLPEAPWVAYASPQGNNLINMDTGLVLPVAGDRDAVPTPDGRFLTSPGVYFTSLEDLFSDAHRNQPRRLFADLDGEYQSPGILAVHSDATDYRLMIGRYKPTIREFRVSHDAATITPLSKPRRPCGGLTLHLPMLAKDGQEFGAYDVAAKATRLFRIRDDDSCEVTDDLKMPTGKVSFSFDNARVTFHLAVLDQASMSLAENPDDHWTSSVFVYDRASRSIGRVTHHTAGNAYYPAFRRDGTIVYLFKPLDDSFGRYSLVAADPERIDKWLPVDWYTRNCDAGDGDCHKTLALGALWAYSCSARGLDTTPRLAALNTLSLNAGNCTAMVTENWLERRRFVASVLRELPDADELRQLEPADLLPLCPS